MASSPETIQKSLVSRNGQGWTLGFVDSSYTDLAQRWKHPIEAHENMFQKLHPTYIILSAPSASEFLCFSNKG